MTTATPLTALGQEIRFADGTTGRLRFSLGSMALLEQRYGGLGGIIGMFENLDGEALNSVIVGPLIEVIGAGLTGSGGFVPHVTERVTTVREETPDGRKTSRDVREVTAVRYVRQKDRAELGDLLDFRDINSLIDAFQAAFAEAFPQGEGMAPAGPYTDVTLPDTFRGTSSTTSAPSPSTAQTPLSGS